MIYFLAHRGNHDINTIENSYEALLDSIHDKDIDGIELDVRLTKDNKVVVYHDTSIERLSDGIGFVRDKSLKELRTYQLRKDHIVTWITTLEEVLHDIKSSKKILIELKDETGDYKILVDQVCKIITRYQNLNLYVASFRPEMVVYFQKKCKHVKVGVFVGDVINQKYLKHPFDFNVVKPDFIDKIDFSKETFFWTVNDMKTFSRIKERMKGKTFGVITDHPILLQKEM